MDTYEAERVKFDSYVAGAELSEDQVAAAANLLS